MTKASHPRTLDNEVQQNTEYRLMRYALWCGVIPTLAGIPVAIAHGVPTWVAVAAGFALALALVTAGWRWSRSWGWYWSGACTVLVFWPSLVWPYWSGLAGLYALLMLMCVAPVIL